MYNVWCTQMFMDVSYNFWAKLQLQVVETQWLLSVEFHHFDNPYNAKMASGPGFCCCYDEGNYEHAVETLLCSEPCDTWLSASVSHCTEPSPCSFSTSECSKLSTCNFTEKFVFVLSAGIPLEEVSETKNPCNHH